MIAPRPIPAIFGVAGTGLSPNERSFFAQVKPFGFILMQRNCLRQEQIIDLVAALRDCVGRADAPIFIDQEGGRVARLQPPRWPKFPSAASIGAIYRHDRGLGIEAAKIVGSLIGHELNKLGITVNCAPVLDISHPETHEAIGDRAFAADPLIVAELARAWVEGLLSQGVLPVIKHLPGHGRARIDPHFDLPEVPEPQEVVARDYVPFRKLSGLPLGMTSHILFPDIDPDLPTSQSPTIIRGIIRETIGFRGLLISDDLDMKALKGSLLARAQKAMAAGTDLVMICNSAVPLLYEVGTLLQPMADESWARWQDAQSFLRKPQFIDVHGLNHRLDMIAAVAEASNSFNWDI